MTKSIFNTTDVGEFIQRIEKLTPASKAQWGKMNINQMLAHCQQPLKVATGELKLKRTLMGRVFGKMAKKQLMNRPFKKSIPTDKNFVIKDPSAFETEKSQLIALLSRFPERGVALLSKEPHPFFGPLTPHEWDVLQTKHLDHHLTQFGV